MPACWVCCLHSWNLSGLATRWLEREPKLIQLAWLDKSRAEEKDLPFFWQPVDEWFWNIAFTDLLEDSTWYRQWKKQNNSFEIYFNLWSIFSKTNWRHKRRKTERKKETGKSQLHALPPPQTSNKIWKVRDGRNCTYNIYKIFFSLAFFL